MLTTENYFLVIEAVFIKTIFLSHSSYFFGVIHLTYCIHTVCSKDRE